MMSLLEMVRQQAKKAPEAPFATHIRAGTTLTYGAFADLADRLRAYLHERGTLPGDRIALVSTNHWVFHPLLAACAEEGRILVPVSRRPSPQGAIEMASRAAKVVGEGTVEISLLHVGGSEKMPPMKLPEDPSCSWKEIARRGDAAKEIVAAADEPPADLIVMVTEDQPGVLSALRGSVPDRVLRQAPCPVLAVPLAWVDLVTETRWS